MSWDLKEELEFACGEEKVTSWGQERDQGLWGTRVHSAQMSWAGQCCGPQDESDLPSRGSWSDGGEVLGPRWLQPLGQSPGEEVEGATTIRDRACAGA